jgi:hypothetical protein
MFPTIRGNQTAAGDGRSQPAAVSSAGRGLPRQYDPTITITYHLPVSATVDMSLSDVAGRDVARMTGRRQDAGTHEFRFLARDLRSGIYFFTIAAKDFIQIKKVLVVR